ncbi:hypothetical protein ARAM_002144 [Aspergillus rambellii]|uniref:AMP-dependent synthetase/ligase domain-containing protein n=1 Tax=Aspergillus rambellii TaxID=308745 RepID=A0A0F8UUN7_9EURO|nr:hypothetical protein ARAM_002144 [Aspergillus rambellii]
MMSQYTLPPSLRKNAEIDGGRLANESSVFEHIEQGYRRNPHSLAVISTHQPAGHLASVVPRDDKVDDQHVTRYSCLGWTYSQLHRTSLQLLGGMLANGTQPNSTILMLIPNGGEYALLLWTSVLLRLTYACVDPSLLEPSKNQELQAILDLVNPSLVVVRDSAGALALDALLAKTTPNNQRQHPVLQITLEETARPGWISLCTLAACSGLSPEQADGHLAAARADSPARTHSILFTSGTSSNPKGCPLRVSGMSHALQSQSWLVNAENGARALQQGHNSRGIAPAQTLQTWRAGGAVVMTGGGFDASDLVDAVVDYRATFIVLTPAMVRAVGQEIEARERQTQERVDVDSVTSVQVGGDAVTKDVLDRCGRLFVRAKVCVNHGMTEGMGAFYWPFSEMTVPDIPFYGEMAPIGAVAPGTVVRIWDREGESVAGRGELGELHMSCGGTIPGYLGGVAEDSFYHDSKGIRWFNTGDVAMIDGDGVVFILGRKKDMIRKSGTVIMPAALESCIEKLTSKEVCVVSIAHPELGHEPFAVLASLNGKTEAQIKQHVIRSFGQKYALGGVSTLEQLGLREFPVNATHKLIKADVQSAVAKYFTR